MQIEFKALKVPAQEKINITNIRMEILDLISKTDDPQDLLELLVSFKEVGVVIEINDPEIQEAIVERIQKNRKMHVYKNRLFYLRDIGLWMQAGLNKKIVDKMITLEFKQQVVDEHTRGEILSILSDDEEEKLKDLLERVHIQMELNELAEPDFVRKFDRQEIARMLTSESD